MTATDELRKLLDERGVKWEDDTPVPSMKPWKTSFTSFTGEEVSLECYGEPKWIMGTLVFHTPEQAIAATLGAGTCKNKATSLRTFWCDCCDCALEDWMDVGGKLVNGLRYCPNCGRVVEG